jgi:predicted branched-subunit amino acid permease
MFIGIVASGGNPLAAAAAGLLVNARHVPFGVTVRELVGKRGLSLLGCHIMNDESVVFGLSQKTPNSVKPPTGCAVWASRSSGRSARCWGPWSANCCPPGNHRAGCGIPAILLALVVPAFKNRTTLIRACSGAVLSLAAVPFAPVGLPVLLSLLGLAARKNNGKHDGLYSRYRHSFGWEPI